MKLKKNRSINFAIEKDEEICIKDSCDCVLVASTQMFNRAARYNFAMVGVETSADYAYLIANVIRSVFGDFSEFPKEERPMKLYLAIAELEQQQPGLFKELVKEVSPLVEWILKKER